MRSRNRRTAGFLGIELKYLDTHVSGHVLNAPNDQTAGLMNPLLLGIANCLNAVSQGDGEQQRDGRKMMMRGISITGHVKVPAVITPPNITVLPDFFIALVLDTQCNGVVPNSQDIYTNPSQIVSLSTRPYRNLQYSQRFKVLATRSLNTNALAIGFNGAGMEQQGEFITFRIDKKFAIPVLFKGTTDNVANIVDNSLNVVAWTSSATIPCQLSYNARMRFVG